MKRFFGKKVLFVLTVVSMLFGISAVSYARSLVKEIKAYQNAGITIEVDGKEVSLTSGNEELYPIIYEERTYVPIRAVVEALGAKVKWDEATQKVIVTSAAKSASPTKDNSEDAESGDPGESLVITVPELKAADVKVTKDTLLDSKGHTSVAFSKLLLMALFDQAGQGRTVAEAYTAEYYKAVSSPEFEVGIEYNIEDTYLTDLTEEKDGRIKAVVSYKVIYWDPEYSFLNKDFDYMNVYFKFVDGVLKIDNVTKF